MQMIYLLLRLTVAAFTLLPFYTVFGDGAVAALCITVKMTPECAFPVCTDCGVRIIPLIHSTTSVIHSTHTTTNTNISLHLCYSLLLGINLWKGMLKKQPPSALFFYILYINLIRIAMHNTHIHMYITNGKPFHIYRYIYCIHLGQIA